MKKHYDFSKSMRNPYCTQAQMQELSQVMKDYSARGPMTKAQFRQWWGGLSPTLQSIIVACVHIIAAIHKVRTEAASKNQ